jgi:hypothetical protein
MKGMRREEEVGLIENVGIGKLRNEGAADGF